MCGNENKNVSFLLKKSTNYWKKKEKKNETNGISENETLLR